MISVIVPVFNGESCLEVTLSSLAKQSLDELEVVIVDDASEDRSAEVASKWATSPSCEAPDKPRRARMGPAQDCDLVICGSDMVTPDRSVIEPKISFGQASLIEEDLLKSEEELLQRFCAHDFGTGALWNKLYRRDLALRHGLREFRWQQDATEDTLVNIGAKAKDDMGAVVSRERSR